MKLFSIICKAGAVLLGICLGSFHFPAASEDLPDKTNSPDNHAALSPPSGTERKPLLELITEAKDIVIRGRHGLKIQVRNNSDKAVIFNGEGAKAVIHGREYKCMDIDEYESLFVELPAIVSGINRNVGQTVLAAVSVGGLQTAKDIINNRKSILSRYGKDEERRQNDQERFGQRILWPGDSSVGIVLFPSEESLVEAVVTLPVSSFYDKDEQSVVSNMTFKH